MKDTQNYILDKITTLEQENKILTKVNLFNQSMLKQHYKIFENLHTKITETIKEDKYNIGGFMNDLNAPICLHMKEINIPSIYISYRNDGSISNENLELAIKLAAQLDCDTCKNGKEILHIKGKKMNFCFDCGRILVEEDAYL